MRIFFKFHYIYNHEITKNHIFLSKVELYNVSPKRACVWKKQLLEQVNLVYKNGNDNQRIELEYENKISDLHRKIGELSIENEYLKKN